MSASKVRAKWASVVFTVFIIALSVGVSVAVVAYEFPQAIISFLAGVLTLLGLIFLALSDIGPRWAAEDGDVSPGHVSGGWFKLREWGHVLVLGGAAYFLAGYIAGLAL